MHSITIFVARYLVFLMPILTICAIYDKPRNKQIRIIAQAAVATIVAFGLAKIFTHVVSSPRPFIADGVQPFFSAARDNGFPSDHTLLAGLIAFTTLLYSRRLGTIAVVLAVLVGVARVASGVHHAVDIVGGIILSALSVYLVNILAQRHRVRRQASAAAHHD